MTKKRKSAAPEEREKPSNVSYDEANEARVKHAEHLRKQGAHAIRVVPGAQGHVIVAEVPEDFKGTLPSTVVATVKGKKVDVPVKTKKAPRYKPELQ